ncbi:hypothetical protein PV767_03990 [Stenotrophomonas rhizophila]|uniref:hypothetical protein n=1 Tax=Stenotrophomonas TaxID=40323 RepID=UPI003B7DD204
MTRLNWPVALLGVLWWYMETKYFGWNQQPGSVAELFADGMALAFFAIAFALPPKHCGVTLVTHEESSHG